MTQPPNATSPLAPLDWHRQRAQDSASRAAAVSAAGRRIGRYRLLAFALFSLAIVWAVIATPMLSLWWPAVVLSLGAFIALVAMHRRNRAAFAALDHRRIYHERAVHRIAREWSALPVPRMAVDLADHPYASDLGITGAASVLQLVDVASSAPGRPTLLDWLLGPPSPAATIDARQRAVRELAARDDVRVELGVLAIGVGELRPQTLERFYEWCDAEGSLADRRGVVWSARALTVSIVATSLLQAIGVLAHPYWLGVVLL
ncbi:MAG: hypothetical protein ACREND_17285, partial [Gemmatimonadaceae bacterium]